MNIGLLRQLGSIDQLAGIRESRLLNGPSGGVRIAEFYNAAGLRFTLVPDRCMDIYDLSYKGVNVSFQSKNGLTAPQLCSAADGEFNEQWPAGMLVTCGLDNVGEHASGDGIYPIHGRISNVPASAFGTRTFWAGEDYRLRASGEMRQTCLYGRNLALQRTVETGLNDRSLTIHDTITNYDAADEPYMLLYHFNFGYPLLQEGTRVEISPADTHGMNPISNDHRHMTVPVDGCGEELFFHTNLGSRACGVIWNEQLELGAYIAFDTKNLPNLVEWKMMKSHDYVLALEPCNTRGVNRTQAVENGNIAVLPAYSSIENHLELGILDGLGEIRAFVKNI